MGRRPVWQVRVPRLCTAEPRRFGRRRGRRPGRRRRVPSGCARSRSRRRVTGGREPSTPPASRGSAASPRAATSCHASCESCRMARRSRAAVRGVRAWYSRFSIQSVSSRSARSTPPCRVRSISRSRTRMAAPARGALEVSRISGSSVNSTAAGILPAGSSRCAPTLPGAPAQGRTTAKNAGKDHGEEGVGEPVDDGGDHPGHRERVVPRCRHLAPVEDEQVAGPLDRVVEVVGERPVRSECPPCHFGGEESLVRQALAQVDGLPPQAPGGLQAPCRLTVGSEWELQLQPCRIGRCPARGGCACAVGHRRPPRAAPCRR